MATVEDADGQNSTSIRVDELYAVSGAAKSAEKPFTPTVLHPTNRKAALSELLPAYDWESAHDDTSMVVAKHTLLHCDLRSRVHTNKLRVYKLDTQDGQPLQLQVRATENIPKGQLVLSPGDGNAVLMKKTDKADKKLAKTNKIHSAMLTHVLLKVRGGAPKPRPGILGVVAAPEPDFDEFLVQSPAMTRGESNVGTIHPYWAVLQNPESARVSNMEFEESIFTDSGIIMKSGSKGEFPSLQKKVELAVSMPTMRNSRMISDGEVLCLSYVPDVVGK